MKLADIMILFVSWLVYFGVFYAFKKNKKLLKLSDELSSGIRAKYLLDNYDRLKSYCPGDFLTRIRTTFLRNNLWSALKFSVTVTATTLCLRSIMRNNVVLIGGWPLHQIVLATLLVFSSVIIVLSIYHRFKAYAQRVELGIDPLVTGKDESSIQLLVHLVIIGTTLFMIVNPQNLIDRILIAISTVEISILLLTETMLKITITDEGIFYQRESHPWQNIAWYRWYDHREGVLVGIEPGGLRSAFLMILPATSMACDELNEMLDRYLPDKRLDDIETDFQITFETSRVTGASA